MKKTIRNIKIKGMELGCLDKGFKTGDKNVTLKGDNIANE